MEHILGYIEHRFELFILDSRSQYNMCNVVLAIPYLKNIKSHYFVSHHQLIYATIVIDYLYDHTLNLDA